MKALILTTSASLRRCTYALKQLNIPWELDFYKFDPTTFDYSTVEIDTPEYKTLLALNKAYWTFYRWRLVIELPSIKLRVLSSIGDFSTKRGHRLAFIPTDGHFDRIFYFD